MPSSLHSLVLILVAGVSLSLAGCPSSTTTNPPEKAGEHDHEDGHDHAHDHAHEGPHGGHIIEIGKEEYHAEWTHDESGKVTVYILDSTMKKDVPTGTDTITIEVKLGENVKTYTLESESPMSAKFEIVDKTLVGSLEARKGLTATLKLDIDGKHYDAPISHDEHSHDHAH